MKVTTVSAAVPRARPAGAHALDAARSRAMPKTTGRGVASEATGPAMSEAEAGRLLEEANALARQAELGLYFRKSEFSEQMIIEVVDKHSGDVIRQIPPEEMLRRMRVLAGTGGLLAETRG